MKLHLKKQSNAKGSNPVEARSSHSKPTTSHAKTRGRSMGVSDVDKSFHYPIREHAANNSYILNSSYQHNPNNYSFDYYQGRNSVNNPNLTVYKAEGKSRKQRQESPMSYYTTNTQTFHHKRGSSKA